MRDRPFPAGKNRKRPTDAPRKGKLAFGSARNKSALVGDCLAIPRVHDRIAHDTYGGKAVRMATTDDIEDLIARSALGDRAAFSRLYDRTSAKLFGIILRVLKDRASAEDALQDAFMKIWRHASRYSANGASPMTWMITIARNTAIDHLRRKRETVDADDAADRLVSSAPTPEQSAVAAGEARRITACLDELEQDRGAAVRGAYLEGRSYADLAESFGVPLNTMRTWLRRSLQRLQECMAR